MSLSFSSSQKRRLFDENGHILTRDDQGEFTCELISLIPEVY